MERDRVGEGLAHAGTGGNGGESSVLGFVEMFHRGFVGLIVPFTSIQSSANDGVTDV